MASYVFFVLLKLFNKQRKFVMYSLHPVRSMNYLSRPRIFSTRYELAKKIEIDKMLHRDEIPAETPRMCKRFSEKRQNEMIILSTFDKSNWPLFAVQCDHLQEQCTRVTKLLSFSHFPFSLSSFSERCHLAHVFRSVTYDLVHQIRYTT